MNSFEIGHSTVWFQAWRVNVGRTVLYLLDTNIPENDQHFQSLTSHVYGGDVDTRIGQEIVLGIGGVRFLRSIDVDPVVYHMNEGHSAFLVLELLRERILEGTSAGEAAGQVRQKCVFTTHTPVPAGHDRFSSELMQHALGKFWGSTGLSHDELMNFGRVNPGDGQEPFTMTVLALRMSRSANGVSALHGQVSREMWKELYPNIPVDNVPVGSITNGVHTPSWATARAHEFWNKRLGFDWTLELMEPKFWEGMEVNGLATDEELWAYRYTLRRELIEFVRQRVREQYQRWGGDGPPTLERLLNPDALTICFARRFATYKRAPLLFRNFERILPLFNDPERPLQNVFAG
ncbi:MAG: alpha-glucan family phosphorylase [Bacteroidota bacterium]